MDTKRIADAAREIGGRVQATVDVRGKAAEGRLHEVRDRSRTLYGQAKDAAFHAADDAVLYVGDAYDHAGRHLRQGRRSVSQHVGDNPFAALLIAGAVGFGLALLLDTRRQARLTFPT